MTSGIVSLGSVSTKADADKGARNRFGCPPGRRHGAFRAGHAMRDGSNATAAERVSQPRLELPFAGELPRILGYGLADVQRGRDDPVLLVRVGDRVALAGRRALGAADVAELEVPREDLHEARAHVGAGAHVARLLLDPHDLLERRIALGKGEDFSLRERIQQLDAADRDARVVLARLVAGELVVDLAR